jgi:hypothetical protein
VKKTYCVLSFIVQYKFAIVVMGRQEYIGEEDKPVSLQQFMPQHFHGEDVIGFHF